MTTTQFKVFKIIAPIEWHIWIASHPKDVDDITGLDILFRQKVINQGVKL